jgi:high-affinity Fe2+/Pb2+ permease
VAVEALVQGGLIILVLLLIWIAHQISHRPLKRLIENKMVASKDWIEMPKYGC